MMASTDAGVFAINLITLRPGVAVDEFARFSAELDQPTCLTQEVVRGFDVYSVTREEHRGGRPAIDIVEVMHVASWPEWERVRDSLPEMVPVVEGFRRLVPDNGVRTVFGSRVLPR
jgi:hypothetical protein